MLKQTVHLGMLQLEAEIYIAESFFPIQNEQELARVRADELETYYISLGEYDLLLWHNAKVVDDSIIKGAIDALIFFESLGYELHVTEIPQTK